MKLLTDSYGLEKEQGRGTAYKLITELLTLRLWFHKHLWCMISSFPLIHFSPSSPQLMVATAAFKKLLFLFLPEPWCTCTRGIKHMYDVSDCKMCLWDSYRQNVEDTVELIQSYTHQLLHWSLLWAVISLYVYCHTILCAKVQMLFLFTLTSFTELYSSANNWK